MNQTIIISDDPEWNSTCDAIEVSAQVMASKLVCHVTRTTLEQLVGYPVVDGEAALKAYNIVLFDLEEFLTEAINAQECSPIEIITV
jgi:hypothetical protein